MIETYLIILALANLITEQSIVRKPILKLFRVENYLEFHPIKRFVFDLISCGACSSFHIGWIVSLVIGLSALEAIKIGLISMFLYAVIQKISK